MYRIVEKRVLVPGVILMAIDAPLVARKAKPGEFVILRIDSFGERIPLTIADFDRSLGTITIIFQEVGATTRQLGALDVGDHLVDFVGPLGQPTNIEKIGTVVCIGGGIGVAPIFPIARGQKMAENAVIGIIGARNKDLLILEDEMRAATDLLYVTTDDGSYGRAGLVTQVLQELIDKNTTIDEVIAIGPVVMMRAVSELTKRYGIKTVVSLNPIMVDGTGMCGGCRVNVDGLTKFACVDGPEFDGHKVDFAGLQARQRMYLDYEKKDSAVKSCDREGGCKCK